MRGCCLSRWKQSWVFHLAEQTPRERTLVECQSLLPAPRFSSLLFHFRLPGLGFDSWCCCSFLPPPFCCFHGSFGCQQSDDTAPSAQTEGRSVTQRETSAPRPPPPARRRQHMTQTDTCWKHTTQTHTSHAAVTSVRKPNADRHTNKKLWEKFSHLWRMKI